MPAQFTIGTVSKLTGLSTHTIRAWEKRHQVLEPNRTDSNRRLYKDSDVNRLKLLKTLTESGHMIGQLALLSDIQLQQLVSPISILSKEGPFPSIDLTQENCWKHISNLDYKSLELELTHAGIKFGIDELIANLISPLLKRIGEGWSNGLVTISQEHLASAAISSFLNRIRNSIVVDQNAPRILIATTKNQHHEIGAQMAAIVAAYMGWNVLYLGPNLPADEIANSATRANVKAIGLSFVFPKFDNEAIQELLTIHKLTNAKIPIITGGNATLKIDDLSQTQNTYVCHSLEELKSLLGKFV